MAAVNLSPASPRSSTGTLSYSLNSSRMGAVVDGEHRFLSERPSLSPRECSKTRYQPRPTEGLKADPLHPSPAALCSKCLCFSTRIGSWKWFANEFKMCGSNGRVRGRPRCICGSYGDTQASSSCWDVSRETRHKNSISPTWFEQATPGYEPCHRLQSCALPTELR